MVVNKWENCIPSCQLVPVLHESGGREGVRAGPCQGLNDRAPPAGRPTGGGRDSPWTHYALTPAAAEEEEAIRDLSIYLPRDCIADKNYARNLGRGADGVTGQPSTVGIAAA